MAIAAHGSGDANWYVARLYHIDAAVARYASRFTHRSCRSPNLAFLPTETSRIHRRPDERRRLYGRRDLRHSYCRRYGPNLTPKINSLVVFSMWIASPTAFCLGKYVDGMSGFAQRRLSSGGAVQKFWTGEEYVSARLRPALFPVTDRFRRWSGSRPSAPPELWAGPIGSWKQLTSSNAGVKPAWGDSVNFHWRNGNSKLQGWLMLPVNYVRVRRIRSSSMFMEAPQPPARRVGTRP